MTKKYVKENCGGGANTFDTHSKKQANLIVDEDFDNYKQEMLDTKKMQNILLRMNTGKRKAVVGRYLPTPFHPSERLSTMASSGGDERRKNNWS